MTQTLYAHINKKKKTPKKSQLSSVRKALELTLESFRNASELH
jgi:hypothetical protein